MSWQPWDFGASGSAFIDGADIYAGTINASALKTSTALINDLTAGAISASSLNFVPVKSTDVVASINASAEGIRISGSKIQIDGSVTFGTGYDPSTKATTADVTNARAGAVSDVKNLYGYSSDQTQIDGGKIYTGSILASAIAAGAITTEKLAVGTVSRQNLIVNGHFGAWSSTGTSTAGWALGTGVVVGAAGQYIPKTSAGADASALPVPQLSASVTAGVEKVFLTQDVVVVPGRTYSIVGLLYSQSTGSYFMRARSVESGNRLSSATSGVSAGSIVPPFYQNASRLANNTDTGSLAQAWRLFAYRVTVPNGTSRLRFEIGIIPDGTFTATLYPAFIQIYDDDLIEATASLDMVNQLQNVAFGGDVQGSYSNLTVRGIHGRPVSSTAPLDNQFYIWNAAASSFGLSDIYSLLGFYPANPAGDVYQSITVGEPNTNNGTLEVNGFSVFHDDTTFYGSYNEFNGGVVCTGSTLEVRGGSTVLGCTGVTSAELLVESDGVSYATLRSPAGQKRSLRFQTQGTNRWSFEAGNQAETGGAAGSNLNVIAHADDGSVIDSVLTIQRASGGSLSISRPVSLTSTLAVSGAISGQRLNPNVGGGHIAGTIYKTANEGLVIAGATGTTYSWGFVSGNGNIHMANPWGTDTVKFPVVVASTSTNTGTVVIAGGAGIAGSTNVGGSITVQGGLRTYGHAFTDGAAATSRAFFHDTAGSHRWASLCNGTAESGSNAGSNFEIAAYNDSGNYIDSPLSIVRAAGGSVSISRPLIVNGGVNINSSTVVQGGNTLAANTYNYLNAAAGYAKGVMLETAGNYRWCIASDNSAESGGDAGSSFVLYAYTDAGAYIDTPITITRAAAGWMTLSRPINMLKGQAVIGANTVASPSLKLNGTAATGKFITILTAGSARWNLCAVDTETGSGTTGSNLYFIAYDDTGAQIDYPLVISRAAGGAISMQRPLYMNGSENRVNKGSSYGTLRVAGGSNELLQFGAGNASITTTTFGNGACATAYGAYVSTTSTGVLAFYTGTNNTLAGQFAATGAFTVNSTVTASGAIKSTATGGTYGVQLENAAGNNMGIASYRSGVLRWVNILGDGTLEGSNNQGSDYRLLCYGNTGAFIDEPINIARQAGGAMTLSRPVVCASTLTATQLNGSGAGITASTLPIASINASGTRSSSTFLRGDGTWSAPPRSFPNYASPTTKATGITYQAATDGWLCVQADSDVNVYIGPNNRTEILLWQSVDSSGGYAPRMTAAMLPIPSGYYYRIDQGNIVGSPTITWYPVG